MKVVFIKCAFLSLASLLAVCLLSYLSVSAASDGFPLINVKCVVISELD